METNLALGITFVFLCGLSIMLGNLALCGRKSVSNTSLADPTLLSMSLGLAAGVMVFVSFAELFPEAQGQFTDNGYKNPFIAAIISLFLGSLFTAILDWIVHLCGHHGHSHGVIQVSEEDSLVDDHAFEHPADEQNKFLSLDGENAADELQTLRSMSILTSLSLALHNFPEGLGVVVATVDQPSVGATLAVAVALHNIPLGLSIVMSIWLTKRSVWQCVLTTFLIGLTQPLGGLVGYYLLEEVFSGMAAAVLYGAIAGMMIYIAVKELLPMASSYDKAKRVTTPAFFIGMALVAATMGIMGDGGHGH